MGTISAVGPDDIAGRISRLQQQQESGGDEAVSHLQVEPRREALVDGLEAPIEQPEQTEKPEGLAGALSGMVYDSCWVRHGQIGGEIIGAPPGADIVLDTKPPPASFPASQLGNISNPGAATTSMLEQMNAAREAAKPQAREVIRQQTSQLVDDIVNQRLGGGANITDGLLASMTSAERDAFVDSVAAEFERANPKAFYQLTTNLVMGRASKEPQQLGSSDLKKIRSTIAAELGTGETGRQVTIAQTVNRVTSAPEGSVLAQAREGLSDEALNAAISSMFPSGQADFLARSFGLTDEKLASVVRLAAQAAVTAA